MPADPLEAARELPIDTASWARVMNALAGGVHHYAADREHAAAIEARWPGTGEQIRRAREFHARAAERAVARHGVRGIIVTTAGLPVHPDPHTYAFAAHPGVRAVYAAPAGEPPLVNQAVLGADPRIAACAASVRDPQALLSAPQVRALPGPWCLLVPFAPAWWPPGIAAALFAAYGALLPAGTVLIVTMGVFSGDAAAAACSRAGRAWAHAPEDLRRWLEDAGMAVEPPGVADIRTWGKPEWVRRAFPHRAPGWIAAAVATVG